jgi:GxxExxY protein
LTAEDTEVTEDCMLSHQAPSRQSGQVVDEAMRVHSLLGPGLLESAYEACPAYELRSRGLTVRQRVPIPIVYGDVRLDAGYSADLVVEQAIVVELKAVTKLIPVHGAQLLSYLRPSGLKIGFLINFHEPRLRDGLKRYVCG